MGVCRSCRSHVSGSTCPHCGGEVVEKSLFSPKKNSSSSSSSYSSYDDTGEKLEKGCSSLTGCIGGKISAFIRTYIFFVLIGIVLTYFLQQNNIEFIKKYYDILQFVRIFCLMLGWIPALIVASLKKW